MGESCFQGCTSIQSAIVKGTCRELKESVFKDCISLATIQLPLTIERIGDNAFRNCAISELPSLPKLKYIGKYAFSNCENIKKIVLPSIDTIRSEAFYLCTKLESVSLPQKTVDFGDDCFALTNIRNIVVPYKSYYSSLFGKEADLVKDTINIYTLGYPKYFNEHSKVNIYHTQDCNYKEENYKPILSYSKKMKTIELIKHKISGCEIDSISYNGSIVNGLYLKNLPFQEYDKFKIYLNILGSQYYSYVRLKRPKPTFTIDHIEATETTISLTGIKASEDESAKITKIIWGKSECKNAGNIVRKGFRPHTYISIQPILYYNDDGYIPDSYEGIMTKPIDDLLVKFVTPTTVHFSTKSNKSGDLVLRKQEIDFDGQTYEIGRKEIEIHNLDINKSYAFKYRIYYDFYAESNYDYEKKIEYSSLYDRTFHTPTVQLKTIEGSNSVSNTVAIICAKTNLDNVETSAGFEWRKYDAPELVPSAKANCPIIDGVMMGALKNLSTNTYYKFRPYYTAKDGTEYYGDWSAFGTADAYVYFDPTVRTYNVNNIHDNHVTARGYAIAGSDPIIEQGFEYWECSSESSSTKRLLSEFNKQIVKAEGQWMTVTIANLIGGRNYAIRAFVKTAKDTTYGETQTFTTTNSTGIGNVFGKNETMNLKIISQSHNAITLNLSGIQNEGQYQLFNINGLKVCSGVLNTMSNIKQIQTPNLSTGIYLLKISDSKQSKVVRVIIR